MKKTNTQAMIKPAEASDVQEVGSDLLSQLVGDYRAKSGLSLEDLARMTELPLEALVALEEGSKKLPLSSLYAVCNILNIPPSEIEAACFGRL